MRMRQGWDSEARNWERFARTPGHDHDHEKINWPAFLELLPPPGHRTLDLGCGEGRIGRDLRARGYRVVGADASAAMVRLAQGHAAAAPSLVADAVRLPFADGAFGLAVAYMMLHDVDRMPEAVAEIGRVLAPGGVLCMAIVHPLNSAGSFPDKAPDGPFVIAGSYLEQAPLEMVVERGGIRVTFHSEHRPLESYSRALEAAGLRIEAIREVGSTKELAASKPSDYRWVRVPLFLHVRAVK